MRLMVLALTAILMGVAQARAHDSANDMLAGCRDYIDVGSGRTPMKDADLGAAAECLGTIKTLLVLEELLTPPFRFCRPKGVTISDAIELAVREIEARPQMKQKSFVIMAIAAFQQRWPCR
jgi:Ssp1 endopeptidase immunity protein Rap1a